MHGIVSGSVVKPDIYSQQTEGAVCAVAEFGPLRLHSLLQRDTRVSAAFAS